MHAIYETLRTVPMFHFEEDITCKELFRIYGSTKRPKRHHSFICPYLKILKLKDETILNDTPSGTADMITIELAGQEFVLLSAGPYFKFTPAVSFLIACDTVTEVETLWGRLSENGDALMPLDSYPFSKKYGWIADKYGLSWQVMYTENAEIKQKITPTLMFVGEQCGNAEEAMNFYTSIFQNSKLGVYSAMVRVLLQISQVQYMQELHT